MADRYQAPDVQEILPEWKVYYGEGYWRHTGRSHAGKEISVNKHFKWADRDWIIPSVYSCSKGLVVEFCMKVEAEKIKAFMEKWKLDPDNEEYRELTREEEMQLDADNPLSFDFNAEVMLNGKVLKQERGCGMSYNPCLAGYYANEEEVNRIIEHYGLDYKFGWMFMRFCYRWNTIRKSDMKALTICMKQQEVSVPGIRFRVNAPGDEVAFVHPVSGQEYTLTVKEYEQQELPKNCFAGNGMEYPTHYRSMSYTVTPELPRNALAVMDCVQGDNPRRKRKGNASESIAACSVGIIGGADGPTAIILGNSAKAQLRGAFSSLHFEPVEDVEWYIVFRDKQFEDEAFQII